MRMIYTSNLGIPRIGANRELKFALEKYWKNQITAQALRETGAVIQKNNWILQKELGVDFIPSNDFSYYDHVLDTSILLGAIPDRFLNESELKDLDLYFAMARGARSKAGQVLPAMEMTKWFNTNYHFLVPEINDNTRFKLVASKPLNAYRAARDLGIETRPVLLGPVTYLLLGKSEKEGFSPLARLGDLLPLYSQLFGELAAAGAAWIQLDEPALCTDLDSFGNAAYLELFSYFSRIFNRPKIMLASYFGDLTANAEVILGSPFEGLHIDLFNCLDPDLLLKRLDKKTTISLGVVDGRNVWKNNLGKSLDVLKTIQDRHAFNDLIIAPSCSMLHVPQDLELENNLPAEVAVWLAFARQKLGEIAELKKAASLDFTPTPAFADNRKIIQKRADSLHNNAGEDASFSLKRNSPFAVRKAIQKRKYNLPLLPATTIGSFPQTIEIRSLRSRLQKNEIDEAQYQAAIKAEIEKTIRFQEQIGLDVLVHGEFERNDMVQYFAEKLEGFAFTENGWVQSFGSRCVRPPIIYRNVNRPEPMTVDWAAYSQSLTQKPVKGMLTGPVTILQWSFVRDDQPRSQTCRQIAAAIRAEVADLEKGGIGIIQIDEPALREGLPLQKKGWEEYLKWAVECFQIASAGARDATQIHTHMCYAEFNDIIEAIGRMDADVISIEASRSKMDLLEAFEKYHYPNDIGPGVYDIHSPNVPEANEMVQLIHNALKVIPAGQLWINPDCGLKTRRWEEVIPSLENMIEAVNIVRAELNQ